MHSSQLEEVGFGFSSLVDVENIPNLTDTNEEKLNGKTFDEVTAVLDTRKIKEVNQRFIYFNIQLKFSAHNNLIHYFVICWLISFKKNHSAVSCSLNIYFLFWILIFYIIF